MDELTDTDSEGDFQPMALAIPPVEIVPFPDFNNLQPMIPAPEDEIQVEDLLRCVGNNIPAPDSPQQNIPAPKSPQQNIQIGMVQIVQPSADSIFGNLSPLGPLPPLDSSSGVAYWSQAPTGPSPNAIRYWVKFFSHHSNASNSILIPDAWMNFFSFLLLQSPTFDWAKGFLQSKAWEFFGAESSGNATLSSLLSLSLSVQMLKSLYATILCLPLLLSQSILMMNMVQNWRKPAHQQCRHLRREGQQTKARLLSLKMMSGGVQDSRSRTNVSNPLTAKPRIAWAAPLLHPPSLRRSSKTQVPPFVVWTLQT